MAQWRVRAAAGADADLRAAAVAPDHLEHGVAVVGLGDGRADPSIGGSECLHWKRRASECPRSEIMSAGPRSPLISAIGLDPGDPRLLELWQAAGLRRRAPDDVVHGFSCLERLAHRPNERLPFGR